MEEFDKQEEAGSRGTDFLKEKIRKLGEKK
jgi:hypothetical protein